MNVIAMPSPDARSDRLTALMAEQDAAYDKVRAALCTLERPVPGRTVGPVGLLLMALNVAASRVQSHLENRMSVLQRDVLDLLASDGLTEVQRSDAIAIVNRGRRNRLRDAKLLSDLETELLQGFRSLDSADAQVVRGLIRRLAATAPAEVTR